MVRVVAIMIGIVCILLIWPLERLDFSYNPSMAALIVSLFASVALETGMRRLSTPGTCLRSVFHVIFCGVAFGVIYLALVILVAFIGNSLPSEIGMRLGNTMSQIRFFTPSATILAMCVVLIRTIIEKRVST
jgi:hypothetical protein